MCVVGCVHGELDAVYRTVAFADAASGRRTQLVLVCGDMQAVRDHSDMASMSVPPRYRRMGDFQAYYNGTKRAPVLTLFVGGNHEASTHLWQLYHGGWAAPNIYYLGAAGVVHCCGLRIAGVSGITKSHDSACGYAVPPPQPPQHQPQDAATRHQAQRFDNWCHSVYHTRDYEVFRMDTLAAPTAAAAGAQQRIDVFLSHDWPVGMAALGDTQALWRAKRDFRAEAERLGSPQLRALMDRLQPRYWFAAHHHVKHAVLVRHPSGAETRFLALGKVLPHNDFMQFVDVPVSATASAAAEEDGVVDLDEQFGCAESGLAFDLEWLHSVHATAPWFPVDDRRRFVFPAPESPCCAALRLKPGDVRVTDKHQLARLLAVPQPRSSEESSEEATARTVDPPEQQQGHFLERLVALFGPFPVPESTTPATTAQAEPQVEATNPEEIALDDE